MSQNTPILSEMGRPVARERFSDGELGLIREEFSRRFMEVFDHASQSEIARRLGTTQATVRAYVLGERLPIAEMLITIARRTGVSVDWLLLGRGEKWFLPASDGFTPEEEQAIEDLAGKSGRTFGEQVRVMTLAALETNSRL